MANESKSEEPKTLGWIKGALGALAGLLSGGVMMYLSPLVDRVVKPPRPLANFAVETDGLTATFHNRFSGEGWWDFGDGSPLEPATPQEASVAHTYPKAGTFTAKLLVRNYFGDEHERSVGLDVTVAGTNSTTPVIAAFDAQLVGDQRAAPATFRVTAQTTNAERCLLDFGGDRQPEVISDTAAKQERTITFAAAGEHTIQFTALSGNQAVKRSVTVRVDPPRADVLVARLHVADRGMAAQKRTSSELIPVGAIRQAGRTVKIDRTLDARNGSLITDAKLAPLDPAFQNMKVEIAKGGKSVHLTGDLTPTAAMMQSPNPPMIQVSLTQERQAKMIAPPSEVTASVTLPGSAVLKLPALPAGCGASERTVTLEMHNASGQNWQQALQTPSSISWQGKQYTITATQTAGEVRIDVAPSVIGLTSRPK